MLGRIGTNVSGIAPSGCGACAGAEAGLEEERMRHVPSAFCSPDLCLVFTRSPSYICTLFPSMNCTHPRFVL